MHRFTVSLLALALAGCASAPTSKTANEPYDLLIRNGMVYDGSGAPSQRVDVAVRGDRIAALLPAGSDALASRTVDARGQAVAPGFINMLSWAPESLIADGRGMSDTKQGVTLEVFGEGWSMGPYNDRMKADALKQQGDIRYPIEWTTLGEYLDYLQKRGITPNVASFVGATTVRIHELGEDDVKPDAAQLARMQDLVRQAMDEGALGVGGSLIYPPAAFADSDELTALAQGRGRIRRRLHRAHAQRSRPVPGSAGRNHRHRPRHRTTRRGLPPEGGGRKELAEDGPGHRQDRGGARRRASRSAPTCMPTPPAPPALPPGLPPWVQAGGHEAMVARLKDPAIRKRVIAEMKDPDVDWENIRMLTGSDDRVLLLEFKNEKLKPLLGKSLAEVAKARGKSGEETLIDLVIEDDSRVGAAFFLMSEENVELGLKQPWTSLGSDAESSAPEGVFLKSSTHPRAYGNFARFLGHYVRDRKLMPLEEGIHRLTGLPARNWKLKDRGCLPAGLLRRHRRIRSGHHRRPRHLRPAAAVRDRRGDVFVNGVQVLRDGEHTGAKPGRVVRGPGWKK